MPSSGTELGEPPELPLRRGRRPRPRAADRARRRVHPLRPCGGDRRGRHRAPEPRADDAGQRDRHLQRARGRRRDAGHPRAPRRVLDERGLRPARLQRPGRPRDDDRIGRRGPLDVRGLEARGRAHGPRVPLGARPPRGLAAAVQHLRPRPDRRRRDPRVHRGRAGRRATSRSTATARRSAPGATSTTWSRRSSSRSSTPRPSARASTSATRGRP